MNLAFLKLIDNQKMKKIFILAIFFFLIPSTKADEKYKSFRETFSNKKNSKFINEDFQTSNNGILFDLLYLVHVSADM